MISLMTFEPKSSMSTAASTRNRIGQLWRALSQRNQWHLIDDIDAWIDQVAANLPDSTTLPDEKIAIALQRAYSVRLYRGIQNREDRAAYELWLACLRMARYTLGLQVEDAEELAQEAVARVLEKLPMLRSPQSLVAWAYQILRTVLRDQRTQKQRVESSLDEIDTSSMDVEDPTEAPADAVEHSMVTEKLLNVLKSKIPNDLERLIMLRILMYGDQPRDIAQDLDLPLYRTRIAKSRVLARLRDDKDFMRLLAELGDRI